MAKAKTEKKTTPKATKKVEPKTINVFGVELPTKGRFSQKMEGFQLLVLKGSDEAAMRELENSGRVVGMIRYDDPTLPSDADSVIVAVRN